MSYPTKVNKFIPWSKAMVAGATVDKPDYGKGMAGSRAPSNNMRMKRRKRRRRKRNATKKEG